MRRILFYSFLSAMALIAAALVIDIHSIRHPAYGILDFDDIPREMKQMSPVANFLNAMVRAGEKLPEQASVVSCYEKRTGQDYPASLEYAVEQDGQYALRMALWSRYAIRYSSRDLACYGTGWSFVSPDGQPTMPGF